MLGPRQPEPGWHPTIQPDPMSDGARACTPDPRRGPPTPSAQGDCFGNGQRPAMHLGLIDEPLVVRPRSIRHHQGFVALWRGSSKLWSNAPLCPVRSGHPVDRRDGAEQEGCSWDPSVIGSRRNQSEARATKTNSWPGRSGASRTSHTVRFAATSESASSRWLRNRNVESDVSTAPSISNAKVERKETRSSVTSMTSTHVSTAPTAGMTVREYESSRFHLDHARA